MKKPTEEQQKVIDSLVPELIVSASAGSGKTSTIIDKITSIVKQGTPISRLLIVTYTRAAANEMKERLVSQLLSGEKNEYVLDQIDDIPTSDISTVHSFLEKVIKRNINLLDIDENFVILDENRSLEIRRRALQESEELFVDSEEYKDLYFCLHKDVELIQKIIFKLENHLSVQAEPEKMLNYYMENQKEIFEEAKKRVNAKLVEGAISISSSLSKLLENVDNENKYYTYIVDLKNIFDEMNKERDLRENISILTTKKPIKPRTVGEGFDYDKLLKIKGKIEKIVKKYSIFELEEERVWLGNPEHILTIYKLYIEYQKKVGEIKKKENLLDFNDLERFSIRLLESEEVLKDVTEDYDYIFVDEYQDINPVQEKIIKTLKKSSKFVGVGDPKQGIYGFRNATPEIMKSDIRNLEPKDGVLYLKSNFRSDKSILDFVNDVFHVIMDEENTGIDYLSTSMFKSEVGHFDDGLPSVNIDVIRPDAKGEKKEKKEIYNLLEDELVSNEKCKLEAKVVANRVEELLKGKIYDNKLETFRDVDYSDIVILTRGRSEVTEAVVNEIDKRGIPLISSINKEISNCEIDMIINLLKICIDDKNDIALASVMLSKLGGFAVEDLVEINKGEDCFYKNVKNSPKTRIFFEKISSFKQDVVVKGSRFALQKLFDNEEYYSYLLYQEGGVNTKSEIERMVEIIGNSAYNFDVPNLIDFLENGKIQGRSGGAGERAVTLSTIHSSKGLEYPIVILIGTGRSIITQNTQKITINNDFGLGINHYKEESKEESILSFEIKEENRKKEFIAELMVLYVALTRAKNHLYITGTCELSDVTEIEGAKDVFEKPSFMEILLSSLGGRLKEFMNTGESYFENSVKINYIDDVENVSISNSSQIIAKKDEEMAEKIEKYLDFVYPNIKSTQTRYKNSVTGLNRTDEVLKSFSGGEINLEIGIAYHECLKMLDFSKIERVEDINIENIEGKELIDKSILLKDILKIKEISNGLRVYKEKQFTMKMPACELIEGGLDENVMVQGIIDFFALGDKNILIDYKWTNEKNPEIIKNKYKKQLFLYEKALEKGLNIKINEIYLLSLKHVEIIRLK